MSTKKFTHGIGARLRVTRLALGYSQPELADIIGVNRNTVGSWERDETDVPCSVAAVLDHAGCNSTYLITGDGTMLRRDTADIRAALEQAVDTQAA